MSAFVTLAGLILAVAPLGMTCAAIQLGQHVERSIAAGDQHDYLVDDSEAGILVVIPSGADVSIRINTETLIAVDAQRREPGVEWLRLPASPVSLSIHANTAEAGATYRLERRHFESLSNEDRFFELTRLAATQNLHRNDERSQAIDMYLSAIADQDGPQHADLHMYAALRVADIFRRESKFADAFTQYEKTARIRAVEGLLPWIHIQMGSMQDLLDSPSETRKHLCDALEMLSREPACDLQTLSSSEFSNPAWASDAINRLGLLLHKRGELDTARNWYVLALQINPAQRTSQEAVILNNLGGLAYVQGRFPEALESFDRAYDIYLATGNLHEAGTALGNQASVHIMVGEVDIALDKLVRSLQIRREEQNLAGEAVVLHRIGVLYTGLGNWQEAQTFLVRSLDLKEEFELAGIEQSRLLLGRVLRKQGKLIEAVENHELAYKRYAEHQRLPGQLEAVLALTRDHIVTRNFDLADERIEEGLRLARAVADQRSRGRLLTMRGVTFRERGDHDGAAASFEEAISLNRSSADIAGEIDSLVELTRLQEQIGCLECAIEAIANADGLLRQARSDISNPTLRAYFGSEYVEVHELRVAILMKQGLNEEALQVALNGRTKVLLERIAGSATQASVTDPLRKEIRMLKRQLSARSTALRETQRIWPHRNVATATANEIADLTTRLDALESKFMADKFNHTPDTAVSAIQASLAPDELVVIAFAGTDIGWVWRLTRNDLKVSPLPGRDDLKEIIEKTTSEVRRSPRLTATQTQRLADLMLGHDPLSSRRVFVVPDGVTALIPYNALVVAGASAMSDARPEITVVPVATLLLRSEVSRSKHAAVLLGDPVFGADDPRLNETGSAASESLYPRLPNTAVEIDAVKRVLKDSGFAVNDFIGLDANKEALLGLDLSQVGVLHLATHGVVDFDRPNLSGLVLSSLTRGGSQTDLLTLSEIYDLGLNADLVVLSACDTALGKEVKGEGPISLARGFLSSGAKQVVASLWQVPDRATAKLMEVFYGYWTAGKSASESLRLAQTELSRTGPWRRPNYWAGFVVIGS